MQKALGNKKQSSDGRRQKLLSSWLSNIKDLEDGSDLDLLFPSYFSLHLVYSSSSSSDSTSTVEIGG